MARYDFASDNAAPATPETMAALAAANAGFTSGYGTDPVTARAAELIRRWLDADAEVRFVASGTAANALSLSALCQPFEAVCAHAHAHICTDEAADGSVRLVCSWATTEALVEEVAQALHAAA